MSVRPPFYGGVMFDDLDPLTCEPGEILERIADLAPGSFVQACLLMIDPSRLSPEDAVTYVQIHERVAAWWASLQVEALVAAASAQPRVQEFTVLSALSDEARQIRIEDAVREEVAAAVRWSPATAQARIDTARLLAGALSLTAEALGNGELSTAHASVLADHARRLPGHLQRDESERAAFVEACAELQRRVLPIARRGTLSETRSAARRAVLAIDAEGERRRRERARCTRDVYVVDDVDGLSTLMARMATEDAHAVLRQLDATARATKAASQVEGAADADAGGSWTIGEHRAHALKAAVLGRSVGADEPASAPLRAHLDVVVDLPTLLTLREECSEASASVELRGAGRVSAAVVADLLGDPEVSLTLRRLVTDPLTGHLLDYGRSTYAIPERLREFLVARDRTCRFPGCNRRADLCQVDHALAWDDGGATSPANLGMLCVRHHQLKTHAGWEISESSDDGSCTWRSPEGRRHRVEPAVIHGPPPF